jgi:ectoine hydroxylase-related dioxygenase (phytanoyl-CoA dioxygenase family)
VLAEWKRQFLPLLNERIQDGTASARGPNRYYISLPFIPPFADPAIYEDPDILAIIEQLAQEDIVMPELATDTPLQGSDYQVIHRDMLQCSPDMPDADPVRPFQFAVNFPLVDVTLENGPFEIAPGTHLLTDTECQDRVRSGQAEAQLVPLVMSVGDVMIRDVRALHRGTPNTTAEPRPMVVVGYNCARHQRPQLRIFIPQEQKRLLSDRAQQLLRFNPVVNSLSEVVASETYSNLYFLDKT